MRTQVHSGAGAGREWRVPATAPTVKAWRRWTAPRMSKGWTGQQAVWQGVSVAMVTGLVWSVTGQVGTAAAVGGLNAMFWALVWCIDGPEE